MRRKTLWLCITMLLTFATNVISAPNLINYQGLLTYGVGVPIDGAVSIEFRLFDAESAGNQLWTETQSVTVDNGVYNVLLGSVTPFPSNLFESDSVWLEVVAAGELLTPRQRLASVPYAMKSGCNPGDFIQCYNADPSSLDSGVCKSGKRFCLPDGSAYGPCAGEVSPSLEICDGLDNDCNGIIDDNPNDQNWYQDADGDGAGVTANVIATCTAPPGYVSDPGDCDDTNPNNYPGNVEICDGQDNDCSGSANYPGELVDADGDGALSCYDCADFNPARYPGNTEIVDGIDNDCNGIVDDIVIGVLSGDTGRVSGEVVLSTPSTILTTIDFGAYGYTADQLTLLSTGAQQIINAGSGGTNDTTKGFSFEILSRGENAVFLKDATEIIYDIQGKTTDFLIDVAGNKVGVTVTRAFTYPPGEVFSVDNAQTLLENQMNDIIESSANVSAQDQWVKQILHVFAYDSTAFNSLVTAYDLIDPMLKVDTIVYLTRTDGDDAFLY